jgi:hypothetical protein
MRGCTRPAAGGCGVLLLALLLAWGAGQIPSAAGYAGVGPNFLPWVVAVALALCGGLAAGEARSGGFRQMDEPSGAARRLARLAWVSAGVLANAAADHHDRLHPQLHAVLHAGGARLRNAEGKAAWRPARAPG